MSITSAPAEELAVLGACMLSDLAIEDATAIITPADFHAAANARIYTAILDVYASGARVDVLSVHRQLDDPDVTLEDIHRLTITVPVVSNTHRYAAVVADAAVRRRLIHAADEAIRLANGDLATTDAADAAEKARALFAGIDMPAGIGAPDGDVSSFLKGTDMSYDWLIPDVLEHRDRLLVTASEGAGKSVLLTQIAVMTAAGIHPWTYQPMPARNVTVVDLENQDRLVARRLHRLRRQAPDMDPQRLRVHCRPEGIDLSTRSDRHWLIDRCHANATELLVIGPAYRMSNGVAEKGDIGGEAAAKLVTGALDDIRIRCNVTLLMETHAPHGGISGRDLRPFGSSVWLRWPEFGIGLARDDDHPNDFKVKHWRGPRDERLWPTKLQKRAGRWPWTPTIPDDYRPSAPELGETA